MPPAAPHDDGANPGEPQEASNTVRESLSVRERDFGMSPYSAPPTSWLEFIWKKYVSIFKIRQLVCMHGRDAKIGEPEKPSGYPRFSN